MDIRGPRLRKQSDEALAFTSSTEDDVRIARHIIEVNIAHMVALMDSGEVDVAVGARCLGFLQRASPKAPPGARAEDFHQQLEQDAVDSLGVETAGYLNYGKSRNDQVATAIRMELRLRVLELAGAIAAVQGALLKLAAERGAAVIPGYTHLQRAQPVTVAHYCFAHFDALQRDAERAMQLYQRVNLSPMGAAAMAGTSVRLDRRGVAKSLGFAGLVRNAMDAVSSRDTAVEALSCATMAAVDASRLAEELVLWSTSEFGIVELDDAYSASSSIMPQKKNPVVPEMARAKSGSVLGSLMAACSILRALPYSYNLDLQEVTPHLWRGMDAACAALRALAGCVETAKVGNVPKGDDDSTAVALANYLVKERGLSFRVAHAIVGQLVKTSVETGRPLRETAPEMMAEVSRRLGKGVTVDTKTVKSLLDQGTFLKRIATEGGSNPRFIASDLRLRRKELSEARGSLTSLTSGLSRSERGLHLKVRGLARGVRSES